MQHPTRRELLRAGVVGSAAAVGAGAVLESANAASAAEILDGAQGDAALLRRIVGIEQLIVAAYAHVLATVSLSAASASSLRVFLSQERAHVHLLSGALLQLGETPPAPPSDVDAVSRQLESLHGSGNLTQLHREAYALPYLVGVETVAEDAYYSAMSKLSDPRLLVLAAEILACEAQHWAVLNELFHPGDVKRAVPYAVVLG